MSDDQSAAGAESHDETKPDPSKNQYPQPVWADGKPAALAEGWEDGAPTRLPVRGDHWVELRPQLLVQELRYLSREGKKEGGENWLKEIALFLAGWSFTFTQGPAKGEPIQLPSYDPYELDASKREKALQKRVQVLDFIPTDDVFRVQATMQWLRDEVRLRYAFPPLAPATDSDRSSASASA